MLLSEALSSRGRDRQNNFLLIRLLASTTVIYGHSFMMAASCNQCFDLVRSTLHYRYSGDLAVHVFFVVSGFLVSHSLETRSLDSFLLARFLRVFPGLITFVLLMAFVVGPLFSDLPLAGYFSSSEVWNFIWRNITQDEFAGTLPGVFQNSNYAGSVAGTLWTLWAEVRVYLMLAILGAFGIAANRWLMLGTVLTLVVVALVWPASLPLVGWNVDYQRISAFFAVGVLAYQFRSFIPLNWTILAILGLAALASHHLPSYQLVMGALISYATLFLAFLPRMPRITGAQDFSYGIYLYGWPIQPSIHAYAPGLGPYSMVLLAVPLAWCAGALSWFAIERPALRLKGVLYRQRSWPMRPSRP